MVTDVVELLGAQWSRLVQHCLACANLSDVVKTPCQSNLLDRVSIEPHVLRDCRGEVRDALGMAAQVRVLRLERVYEGLHDVDGQSAEGELVALELRGSQCYLFTNEALDVAPLDGQPTPVECSLDGQLEVRQLDGLHQV